MKKILLPATIILLIVTLLAAGLYVYMLARPISYGMEYCNVSEYEGGTFEGKITYYPDGKMTIKNTNFNEPIEGNYYYKNGYVFDLRGTTAEERADEISKINEDFDAAINQPFYASKINAFELVPVAVDEYTTVYTCSFATVFAIAGGAVVAILVGLTFVSAIFCKKAKREV